ncbi:Uncharacterised protein [Klebsiella pneumoniae]|nr:Uncharacterised protein [Klebsiella pneumoniae]
MYLTGYLIAAGIMKNVLPKIINFVIGSRFKLLNTVHHS